MANELNTETVAGAWLQTMGADAEPNGWFRVDLMLSDVKSLIEAAEQRGRETERAALVRVLRLAGLHVLAVDIEAGKHLENSNE